MTNAGYSLDVLGDDPVPLSAHALAEGATLFDHRDVRRGLWLNHNGPKADSGDVYLAWVVPRRTCLIACCCGPHWQSTQE